MSVEVASPSAYDHSQIVDSSTPVTKKLSDKQFDPVTFDVLMVPPEDLAEQITIADAPLFKSIQPEVQFLLLRFPKC